MQKYLTTQRNSAGKSNSRTSGNGNGRSAKKTTNTSPLEQLFVRELQDIYWAEKHLVKALPKLHKAANDEELKEAFAGHLQVTQTHVGRLEQAFQLLDKKVQAKKCEAMAGLTKEAEDIIGETEPGTSTRDAGLIIAAQKVEHYEIATYGSLKQLAKTLGNTELSNLMDATLMEEKEADERLTSIAENNINVEATSDE
jgi:ferritin-like metal-binding protein YciE